MRSSISQYSACCVVRLRAARRACVARMGSCHFLECVEPAFQEIHKIGIGILQKGNCTRYGATELCSEHFLAFWLFGFWNCEL